MRKTTLIALFLGLAFGGCAAQQGGGPTTVPSAQVSWKEMAPKERIAHMKKVVLPRMRKVFHAFDAEKFADVNCVTCHGKGAKRGRFQMPNAELPKLNPANRFAKHEKKWLQFMSKKVVPAMLSVLPGVPPWSPRNKSGFGCGTCHLFES